MPDRFYYPYRIVVDVIVYVLVTTAIVVPAYFLLRGVEQRTENFAVRVCKGVNHDRRIDTSRDLDVKRFMLAAAETRVRVARLTTTDPALRRTNLQAARIYRRLARDFGKQPTQICHP